MQDDEVNCDKDHWLPVGTVPPDNPHCVEFDGSLIPDCGQYNLNNQTSYYHIHEYSACPQCVKLSTKQNAKMPISASVRPPKIGMLVPKVKH